jgi:hypothetical protein
MSKKHKPYDRMTAAELAEATREYDEPFAALRASKPLTPAMKAAHRRAANRARGRPRIGKGAAKLYISMERGLLKNADSFARKHGMSRSELIARGVRALIGCAA